MYQEVVSYYNNGNGWRISFQFQGANRILTVEEAKDLKRKLSWALEEIANQPGVEAAADKVPKCCADMKPDPLGYDCVCPICGRTA